MAYTMHDIAIHTLKNALASLTDILKKAEGQPSDNEFFDRKLFHDMKPLSWQVFRVCDIANVMQAHMQGNEMIDLRDDIVSFEQAYARINTTSALLDQINKDVFQSYVDKTVWTGVKDINLKGADFVRDFVVPQAYFHLVTAYDILRKEGVPLGKLDYIMAWLGPRLGQE